MVLVNKTRHLRLLWGAENLPKSYYHPSQWDGEVVAFTWDVVVRMLTTIIQIKHEWCEPQDKRIVSAATYSTTLLVLEPTETKVKDAKQDDEDARLCPILLDVLNLPPPPLLKPPFLLPKGAY